MIEVVYDENGDKWVNVKGNSQDIPDHNFDWKNVKRLRIYSTYWIRLWYRDNNNFCLNVLTHLEVVCFCNFGWQHHNVFPVLTSLTVIPQIDGYSETHNLKMTQMLVNYNRQRLEAYMWLQFCIKEKYGKMFLLDKRLIRHVCDYLLYYHHGEFDCLDGFDYYFKKPNLKKIKK